MSKASVKDLHLQDCYIDTENATLIPRIPCGNMTLRAQLRYAGSIANSISGEGAFISDVRYKAVTLTVEQAARVCRLPSEEL